MFIRSIIICLEPPRHHIHLLSVTTDASLFCWLPSGSLLVSVALDLSMTEEEGLSFALEGSPTWWLVRWEELTRDYPALFLECWIELDRIETELFFSVICYISSSFMS